MSSYRLINALFQKPVDRVPVWIMRQAGRYLPEYRRTRANAGDFLTLCKTPELAAQVTLQPIQRYPLDAAIIFSDILVIPDTLDLGLSFQTGEGPVFAKPIETVEQIERLPTVEVREELSYVLDAIRWTQRELQGKVPLIGFAGSPWTLATYMIEGKSSRDFLKVRSWIYREPQGLQVLLEKLTQLVGDFLLAQIEAGVDAVMLFDTWGGILPYEHYTRCSLDFMRQIIQRIRDQHEQIPIIMFSKNASPHYAVQSLSGCHAIGVDWMSSLKQVREVTKDRVALQGNLDPAILYSEPQVIEREVQRVIETYGKGYGHVFNLGHGILPDIDPEKVSVLIEAVHRYGLKQPITLKETHE